MSVKKPDKRHATRTSWKKGCKSPNPKGAPKHGMSWREIIESVGDELIRGVPKKQAVAGAMYREAIKGNTNAASWLARYGGGTTELSSLSDEQLRLALKEQLRVVVGGEPTWNVPVPPEQDGETPVQL